MEQDATGGQPTDAEAESAPPEKPASTSAGGPPAAAAESSAGTEEHGGGRVEMAKEKLEEVKEKIGPKLEEARSEEHTSELQSRLHLVCRLLLEKKNQQKQI